MEVPSVLHKLLAEAESSTLYSELIKQFNKDLLRANIHTEIPKEITPKALIDTLTEIVSVSMQRGNNNYQNLLYSVDVPEFQAKKIECLEDLIYVLIRREWQKVWYRNKYKVQS